MVLHGKKIKSNIFQLDNLVFTQLCGIAMRTKVTPALATIQVYMGDLEKIFLNKQTLKPTPWKTHNLDAFVIWPHYR